MDYRLENLIVVSNLMSAPPGCECLDGILIGTGLCCLPDRSLIFNCNPNSNGIVTDIHQWPLLLNLNNILSKEFKEVVVVQENWTEYMEEQREFAQFLSERKIRGNLFLTVSSVMSDKLWHGMSEQSSVDTTVRTWLLYGLPKGSNIDWGYVANQLFMDNATLAPFKLCGSVAICIHGADWKNRLTIWSSSLKLLDGLANCFKTVISPSEQIDWDQWDRMSSVPENWLEHSDNN